MIPEIIKFQYQELKRRAKSEEEKIAFLTGEEHKVVRDAIGKRY